MTTIIIKWIYVILFFYFSIIFIQNIYKHDIIISINVVLFSSSLTSIIIIFLQDIKNKNDKIKYLDKLNYTIFNQNRSVGIILSLLNKEEINNIILKKSKDYNNIEEYSKINR